MTSNFSWDGGRIHVYMTNDCSRAFQVSQSGIHAAKGL